MTTKQHQTTFDIATQTSGDARSVLAFCLENDLELAAVIPAGSEVEIPESDYKNEDVLSVYRSKKTILATGEKRSPSEPLGIGTMIIQTNFDVL